jgi:hypothetical protein
MMRKYDARFAATRQEAKSVIAGRPNGKSGQNLFLPKLFWLLFGVFALF